MPIHSAFIAFYEAVQTAQRILVISDGRPDGDSVGSATALVTWLLDLKKNVTAFCAQPVAKPFQLLDNAYRFTTNLTVFDAPYELIVICDAGDPRHGGIQNLLPRTPKGFKLVNIDHHVTNTRYGDLNVVFPEASSTCEVIYHFFQSFSIRMDSRIATSLLTGILTDTSTFTNSATNARAIQAAGDLILHGARYQEIIRFAYKNKSARMLRLWGLGLGRLQKHPIYDLAVTYFLYKDYAELGEEAVDGLSNFLQAVSRETDAVLVLRETHDGWIKGSVRSLTQDVSALAKLFGGGGHKKAAGFIVKGKLEMKNGFVKVVE